MLTKHLQSRAFLSWQLMLYPHKKILLLRCWTILSLKHCNKTRQLCLASIIVCLIMFKNTAAYLKWNYSTRLPDQKIDLFLLAYVWIMQAYYIVAYDCHHVLSYNSVTRSNFWKLTLFKKTHVSLAVWFLLSFAVVTCTLYIFLSCPESFITLFICHFISSLKSCWAVWKKW